MGEMPNYYPPIVAGAEHIHLYAAAVISNSNIILFIIFSSILPFYPGQQMFWEYCINRQFFCK